MAIFFSLAVTLVTTSHRHRLPLTQAVGLLPALERVLQWFVIQVPYEERFEIDIPKTSIAQVVKSITFDVRCPTDSSASAPMSQKLLSSLSKLMISDVKTYAVLYVKCPLLLFHFN